MKLFYDKQLSEKFANKTFEQLKSDEEHKNML